jgi:hypothetical protein
MNAEVAITVAQEYLAGHPSPGPDYEWVVTAPIRHCEGWAFNYQVRCITGLPQDEWHAFGGAPAFIVQEDASVRELGWDELPL